MHLSFKLALRSVIMRHSVLTAASMGIPHRSMAGSTVARLVVDFIAASLAADFTGLPAGADSMAVEAEVAAFTVEVVPSVAEVADTAVEAAVAVAEEAITNPNFGGKSESRRVNRRFSFSGLLGMELAKD